MEGNQQTNDERTDDRAERALTDVAAVERIAPGMVRVITFSDAYVVDARDGGCYCPDHEYNLTPSDRCKHEWAAILATTDTPAPWRVCEDLSAGNTDDPLLVTDGGESGVWTVYDHANDNAREFDNRSDAENAVETVADLGGEPELFAPGASPDDDTETDGGTNAEIVETPDVDPRPDAETADEAAELPERSVADDPLTWMPEHFVDSIDGTPAVNRKGFEVLSHFYDISVSADLQVPPEDTDHEYCRVKATAETPDGRTCEAFGSAHVDRGDDADLLLEMADTRARKRALSIATGTGAVAVEELRNEVDR